MTAAVIDLSDDEVLHVEIPHALNSKSIQDDSDAQLAARLHRKEETKLAAFLQSHKDTVTSSLLHDDAALALSLQRTEDELASKRLIESLSAPSKKARLSSQPEHVGGGRSFRSELVSITAEQNIACTDAVALMRDCFRHAKDLSRSQIFLCGSTPFVFQRRPRGRRESSSLVLATTCDSISAEAPDYWTCGYRNIQMLLGHLQLRQGSGDFSFSKLFDGKVPDVNTLQFELERLWALGYDPDGCQQLGGAVCGTQKWIGTSEACVLLRGRSVRCNIVSFRGETSHTGAVSAADAVMERVFNHFRKGANVEGGQVGSGLVASPQPPLYLQHDGHSRTVVGIQRRQEPGGKHTDFLLVLDPGLGLHGFEEFRNRATLGYGWERFVKRSLAPLRKKGEYELLIVEPDAPISRDNFANSQCIRRFV
eukprot:CAMPEP_0169091790 /NCGR_PEP_ID=MMETSP1015-20121227/16561_1 /TAXON_ID=342587 /ORGANISM="Karlodinium micrum, Strain CCMP2283" /LENGTH=422 /DNA_ID=CAMNT_0009152327 /DNA_START=134 /DNA_END=1402 /DNA_ORIENTATION=+